MPDPTGTPAAHCPCCLSTDLDLVRFILAQSLSPQGHCQPLNSQHSTEPKRYILLEKYVDALIVSLGFYDNHSNINSLAGSHRRLKSLLYSLPFLEVLNVEHTVTKQMQLTMEVVSSTPGWHWGNVLEIKYITVFYGNSQSPLHQRYQSTLGPTVKNSTKL